MRNENDKYTLMPAYGSFQLCLNSRVLTRQQRNHFLHCLRTLRQSSASFIYRGENRRSLNQQYNRGLQEHDNQEFNNLLFMVGQKGRYFGNLDAWQEPAMRLAYDSNHPFELLFRMLHALLKSRYTDNLHTRMEEFRNREAQLYHYFMDMANVPRFIDAIMALTPAEQVQVRDYYLGLLHNMDRSEFYSRSFLLSTSTNLKVAERFAGIHQGRGKENAVIFCGWVPAASKGILRAPDTTILMQSPAIAAATLPFYQKLIFNNQEEVALKGGFLPHYLLGYYRWEGYRAIMELNPALFDIQEGWSGGALPVRDAGFERMLYLTNFTHCFCVDESTGNYHEGRHLRALDVNADLWC